MKAHRMSEPQRKRAVRDQDFAAFLGAARQHTDAARCGFGSEETLRRSFVRVLGVSPQAYRERFVR